MNFTAIVLSKQFQSLAMKWQRLEGNDQMELDLASNCWLAISRAFDLGYLNEIRSDLLDAVKFRTEEAERERSKNKEVYVFFQPGFQFYLLAGYCEIYQDEGGVDYDEEGIEYPRTDRVFRPGLIDYIVPNVFPRLWDWMIPAPFDRTSEPVKSWIFDQYSIVLNLLAEMVLQDATSVKQPPVSSDCELFVFESWLEAKKGGGKADLSKILMLMMQKYPDAESRMITSGDHAGDPIQTNEQIGLVCKRLNQAKVNQAKKRKG